MPNGLPTEISRASGDRPQEATHPHYGHDRPESNLLTQYPRDNNRNSREAANSQSHTGFADDTSLSSLFYNDIMNNIFYQQGGSEVLPFSVQAVPEQPLYEIAAPSFSRLSSDFQAHVQAHWNSEGTGGDTVSAGPENEQEHLSEHHLNSSGQLESHSSDGPIEETGDYQSNLSLRPPNDVRINVSEFSHAMQEIQRNTERLRRQLLAWKSTLSKSQEKLHATRATFQGIEKAVDGPRKQLRELHKAPTNNAEISSDQIHSPQSRKSTLENISKELSQIKGNATCEIHIVSSLPMQDYSVLLQELQDLPLSTIVEGYRKIAGQCQQASQDIESARTKFLKRAGSRMEHIDNLIKYTQQALHEATQEGLSMIASGSSSEIHTNPLFEFASIIVNLSENKATSDNVALAQIEEPPLSQPLPNDATFSFGLQSEKDMLSPNLQERVEPVDLRVQTQGNQATKGVDNNPLSEALQQNIEGVIANQQVINKAYSRFDKILKEKRKRDIIAQDTNKRISISSEENDNRHDTSDQALTQISQENAALEKNPAPEKKLEEPIYDKIRRIPMQFQKATGFTGDDFDLLVQPFEERFREYIQDQRMDGEARSENPRVRSGTLLPRPQDRLFFILVYEKGSDLAQGKHFRLENNNVKRLLNNLEVPLIKTAEYLQKPSCSPQEQRLGRQLDKLFSGE